MRRPIVPVLATLVLTAALGSSPAGAINAGDEADLLELVDENMRVIDMADLVDGTPLVFLYGSAT